MLNGNNQKSFFELKRELIDLIQRIQSVNMLATQYEQGTFARGIGNDKAYASFDQTSREVFIKTEVQGTQYEGRSARIENKSLLKLFTLMVSSAILSASCFSRSRGSP